MFKSPELINEQFVGPEGLTKVRLAVDATQASVVLFRSAWYEISHELRSTVAYATSMMPNLERARVSNNLCV